MLWEEVKKTPSWRPILDEKDIFPTDKMDIDPFLNLTRTTVVQKLLDYEPHTGFHALGVYLWCIRQYYDLWNTNDMDIHEKIWRLCDLDMYFAYIEMHNSDVGWHINRSVRSLIGLTLLLQQYGNYKLEGTSWLSTLVVENFFSQVTTTLNGTL